MKFLSIALLQKKKRHGCIFKILVHKLFLYLLFYTKNLFESYNAF